MSNRVSTCNSGGCAASILWRLNPETGTRVPLDVVPVTSDERFVVKRAYHYRIEDGETCHVATMDEWGDHTVPLHCSHFRTCRDVGRWSRRTAA